MPDGLDGDAGCNAEAVELDPGQPLAVRVGRHGGGNGIERAGERTILQGPHRPPETERIHTGVRAGERGLADWIDGACRIRLVVGPGGVSDAVGVHARGGQADQAPGPRPLDANAHRPVDQHVTRFDDDPRLSRAHSQARVYGVVHAPARPATEREPTWQRQVDTASQTW